MPSLHPTPAISVLVPCYRGEATVERAIRSILDQDFQDFELIIIDDASTDNTWKEISLFAGHAKVRTIRHDTNKGLAATLNEGLALARAPLVARLDQDDEAMPTRLRIQHRFMVENPDITVAGSYVYYAGRTRAQDKLFTMAETHDAIAAVLQQYNCMYHPSVIMRKDHIVAMGGYKKEFRNAEDYDLWLRVARHGRIVNIPEPLTRYTFSVNGMTLGKKWQQLYFVYLAQFSNQFPDRAFPELEAMAQAKIDSTDRRSYFNDVVTGTLKQLTDLGMWADSLRFIWSMTGETGIAKSFSHLKYVAKRFLTPV